MSEIVFLPVNASQKQAFNIKELTTSYNNMIITITDSIFALNSFEGELSKSDITHAIISGIYSVYGQKNTSIEVIPVQLEEKSSSDVDKELQDMKSMFTYKLLQ